MKLSVFIKFAIPVVLTVFYLSSCGRDKICDCIDAGDALNKETSKVLNKGEASKDDQQKIDQLRKIKKNKCAEFENMAGPEMLERKQSCGK